jgi:hypothetical protein
MFLFIFISRQETQGTQREDATEAKIKARKILSTKAQNLEKLILIPKHR